MSVDYAVYRETLSKSFKIAAFGAGLCTVSAVFDLVIYLADLYEMDFIITWLGIVGLLVFGGGLVSAGQKLCDLGHNETGVTSAGGGLIFAGIIGAIMEFFVNDDWMYEGTSSYIWMGLSLFGFVIAYYALKQADDKEDKFFGTASIGFGLIIIVNIILFAALKLILNYGDDLLFRNPNAFLKILIWISEHINTVMIVSGSLIILGNMMCWISIGSYSDFMKEIVEEKRAAEKEEIKENLINEALAEYKERHAKDAAASYEDVEKES
ncbi:MAG: hypothetical protein K2I64_05170 [Muribaculaceae bacterium]|nr:hypothetical protein [Muribaculaceae bacterium]